MAGGEAEEARLWVEPQLGGGHDHVAVVHQLREGRGLGPGAGLEEEEEEEELEGEGEPD